MLKPLHRALASGMALLALACAETPPSGDSEQVQTLVDEALEALAEGAGIRLVHEVPVLVLTAEQASERRKALAPQRDDGGANAAVDWVADTLFAGRMLGRYVPDEQVVYVIEDVLRRHAGGDDAQAEDLLFNVLAHELVHAYDDQVHGVVPQPAELLTSVAAEPARLREVQDLMSLIEGRATYAAELAARAAGRPPLPVPTEAELETTDVDVGEGLLAALGAEVLGAMLRLKLVQYVQGREFAERAWRFGGERFFAEVFRRLPLQPGEINDFDRFRLRWAAELEAEMAAEAEEEGP